MVAFRLLSSDFNNAPATVADAKAKLSIDGLDTTAKSPGAWGKKLRATIDVEASDEVRTRLSLQYIKLENVGWERDYEISEPSEETFTEPQ